MVVARIAADTAMQVTGRDVDMIGAGARSRVPFGTKRLAKVPGDRRRDCVSPASRFSAIAFTSAWSSSTRSTIQSSSSRVIL